MAETQPLPELGDYARHVRLHWLRLIVSGVVGALVGLGLVLALPLQYTATSEVALSPQLTFLSLSTDSEKHTVVTVDTTATLLRSDRAIRGIARAMEVRPSEADRRLSISAKPGSRVLVISVEGDTRRQAVAGANAATESLLGLQSEKFALSEGRVRLLKNRVNVLQAQAQQQIAEGAPAQSLFDTVDILDRRLDNAIATNNTNSTVIVRARVVEFRPGQAQVFIVSGLALGLLVGLGSTLVHRRRAP